MVIAVTNRKLARRSFLDQIQRVIQEKPDGIILREKDLSEQQYKELAQIIMKVCEKANISCILHSYWNVAIELGAENIHLHLSILQKKVPIEKFRQIGVSVHSIEEAKMAEQMGATYLVAGHIFATDCKKGIPPRGLEFFQNLCEQVSIPEFGIGGMTLEKEKIIMQANGAGICIMSEFMMLE